MDTNNTKIKALSLFSGMGGDSLGIEKAGCELVAYSEKEKVFRETHNLNFENCKLIGNGDIKKTTDEEFSKLNGIVNLIFAGFPCQGFSNAGKKKANDPRNTLFREFLRACRLIEPDYIIGENVKGLLSRITEDGENYIDIIKDEFEKLGYNIKYDVLKANEYNIPQKRERLIILGIKKSLNREPYFPNKIESNPNLKNIIEFNMNGAYKIDKSHFDISKEVPKESILTDLTNEEQENNVHPFLRLRASGKNFEYKGKVQENLISFGKRKSGNHIEIIDLTKPSKTIISSYGHQPRLMVALQNKNGYYLRCLLPDELKQIQGFPKEYKLNGSISQQITQIGNAAPPSLIELVVKTLIK
jgi:DNA (cytosine-5)-methyltransferase 1